jgi:class 3 adenylate cyclase/tetratricopeptide (TPR) repeat protein
MTPHHATCPDCGRTLAQGDNFCGRCGRRLSATESPAGAAEASALPAWTEERKLATVLFGDIAGFTRVSSRLEPDEVWTFANTIFGPLAREVELRGGTVVKYIGDSIMAVFGVPRSSEDDAVRAVEAALAMRRRLAELSPEVESLYGAAISMRIGLNSGLLMVGTVGLGSNLDVMGTTVNVASRVESLGRPGEVLITDQTFRAVAGAFDCESMGLVNVKGIEEPLGVHRVLGERTETVRVSSPMTAGEQFLRGDALAELEASLDTVCRTARMRVVRVVGETGMGKNRLLDELERVAVDRAVRTVRVGAGRTAFAGAGSLALIGRVVREAVGVRANEPVAAARARVIEALVSAWPPGARAEAEPAAALLADAAAIRGRTTGYGAFSPGAHPHDSRMAAFSDWIENLARQRPLLLVLEDLEASDEASLDLLERMLRGASALPTLVVLSYQPQLENRRLGWLDDLPNVDRLELTAIEPAALRTLVEALLSDVTGVPESVKDAIVARSEGRPQYAMEIVRLLRDRGVVTAEAETAPHWNAERFRQIELPDSVLGLVQARMDALPALEKEVLKRASVVGQSFWRGSLEHLFAEELAPGEIESALSTLISMALLHGKSTSSLGGEQEFEFRSQALRDVAYRSIPATPRQRWHRRIARWFESQGVLWEGGHGAIAAHLEAGGVPEQALEHYVSAARHAQFLYDARRAAEFYQKALSVWPDGFEPVERATARRELAGALTLIGRFEEASEAVRRATAEFDAAEVPQDAESRAWVDLTLAYLQKTTGEIEASLRTFDRAVARLEGQPPSLVQMWIFGQRASQRLAGADLDGARSDCEVGLAIAEQMTHRDDAWRHGRWMLVNVLGGIMFRTGRLDEAEDRYRDALAVLGSANNPRGRYVAHVNIGAIAFERGRFDEASASFGDALSLSRKLGWSKDEAICLNNLGQTHLAAGHLDEATELLGDALRVAAGSPLLDVLADGGRALAETYLRRAEPERALAEARRAIDAARRGGHPQFEGEAHAVATECLLAGAAPADGGDPVEAAARHFHSAETLLSQSGLTGRLEQLRERYRASPVHGAVG